MLIQNTNPVGGGRRNLLKVREGFQRPDLFVCVHEQFHDRDGRLWPTS